jgi:phosphate transport system protein
MELDELARKIAEMGRLVLEQIAGSIKALVGRDLELTRGVIANRDTVDTMHRDIQEKGIVPIARRQPVACDPREIVGASRIAHDLEHIGDLAEKIAKRVMKAEENFQPGGVLLGIEHKSGACAWPVEPSTRQLFPVTCSVPLRRQAQGGDPAK